MLSPAVHTVLGPISPAQLGPCLPHEHIFCDFYRVTGNLDHLLNDETLALDELAYFSAAGGRAIVDCTTIDAGRDPAALHRAATASGLNLVMSTGWYRQSYYPPEIDVMPTNALADVMVGELLRGIQGSDICAGAIGEIGFERDRPTAAEERVLRAAARAQRATGAPLFTHASMFPAGLPQLDLLDEEGVDPARVVIGHADSYLDVGYHRAILERGAYLAFDSVAREHMNPDARRLDALLRLLDAGWVDRLLVSSDRCYRSDLVAFGGPGYGVVFDSFFGKLQAAGATPDILDRLSVKNPQAILAW